MNTVVYYPHNAPSVAWLTVAALCWDTVYRLLPSQGSPSAYKDPEQIEYLDLAFGGILESVDISEVAAEPQVQEHFQHWASTHASRLRRQMELHWKEKPYPSAQANSGWSEADLANKNNVNSVNIRIFSEVPVHEQNEPVALSSGKFLAHSSRVKCDFDVVELLKKLGLAESKSKPTKLLEPRWRATHVEEFYGTANAPPPPDREDVIRMMQEQEKQARAENDYTKANKLREFLRTIDDVIVVTPRFASTSAVYMPKEVALYYLSICALNVASGGNRDLVADGERFTDPVFHDMRAARGEVAVSTLQACLPGGLAGMDTSKIAEIRSELAARRLKYEAAVQSLCDEFGQVASEAELGRMKSRIIEIAKERVEQTRKVYKRARVDMFLKSFGISIAPPALATSIASTLGIGLFVAAGIAATLSIISAKAFMDIQEARMQRSNSPWSYVLDVARSV